MDSIDKFLKLNYINYIIQICGVLIMYYLGYFGYQFSKNMEYNVFPFNFRDESVANSVLNPLLMERIINGEPFFISIYNSTQDSKYMLNCDMICRSGAYGGKPKFTVPREKLDAVLWAIYDNRIMLHDPHYFPNETKRRVFLDANIIPAKHESFNISFKEYYPMLYQGVIKLSKRT